MKLPGNISIRSRFLLVFLLMILSGLLLTLTIFQNQNLLRTSSEKLFQFERSQSPFSHIHRLLDMHEGISSEDLHQSGLLLEELGLLKENTEALLIENNFKNDSLLVPELEKLIRDISDLILSLHPADTIYSDVAVPSLKNYAATILSQQEQILSILRIQYETVLKNSSFNLLATVFIALILIAVLVFAFLRIDHRNIHSLKQAMIKIASGDRPEKISLTLNPDYNDISDSLESYISGYDKKTAFLDSIMEGGNIEDFNPEKTDILGNRIKLFAARFREIREIEAVRQKEEFKRTWRNEGLTLFAEILRSERENVQELSFKIVQKLVMYLDVIMGSLYLVTEGENEPELETIATYAYDRRKYMKKTFSFGEGLPGTCAMEKEKIYINDIPGDYSDIISGIGYSKPKVILLVPLKIEEEIFGIIEIASIRQLESHELQFIDELANSIALTLAAVKTNQKNARQLEISQEQLAELHQKEKDLLSELEQLEDQHRELLVTNTGLRASLDSLNNYSLFSEFNTAGRYVSISQKFLNHMEITEDLVLGKHHYEFTSTDRYSTEYKDFWNDLKNGISRSIEEEYELLGGKRFILKEIFAPVRNESGSVIRIINIACDITEMREEMESNKTLLREKTAMHKEMENILHAVDSTMVKCELDKDGIISDVNRAFEEASGYTRKELLGHAYTDFLKGKESELYDSIWQGIRKIRPYTGVVRRTKPTFEENWMMTSFTPFTNEEGELEKVVILAFDITEKKLKYQLLDEANKEIERLKQEIGNK